MTAPAAASSRLHARWRLRERLGSEGGATLWAADGQPGDGRWLVLTLPAAHLAADAEARGAALLAPDAADPHLAAVRAWCPPAVGEPAAIGYQAPGAVTVTTLLSEGAAGSPVPDLLGRLVLAEALAGIAAAHRRGLWHGLLGPSSLWLAGAAPASLIADCPRDPRVVLVGCGAHALLAPAARAAAVTAALTGPWAAPELGRGRTGPAGDVWAVGAVVRALVAGPTAELTALLDLLQAARPEDRPAADEASAAARDLALGGLAAWRSMVPPPPRRPGLPVALPRERWLLPAVPRRRPPGESVDAPRRAPTERWALWRSVPGPKVAALRPFAPRPLFPFSAGRDGAAVGLWLSLAPTAFAGILSALLALTLLLAVG